MTQPSITTTIFTILQLIVSIVGLGVVYFNIAKRIGAWDEIQKSTISAIALLRETFREDREEQKGYIKELRIALDAANSTNLQLTQKVYEVVGQVSQLKVGKG